jgi:acetoin utilization deacetylase AcuC-like enzyme
MDDRVRELDRGVAVEHVPVFYSDDFVLAAHAFDTTRKARWVAESLRRDPIPGIDLVEPKSLSEAEVAIVHDPAYVTAVVVGRPLALAESAGFGWDPAYWPMVAASNGGAVAAALRALQVVERVDSLPPARVPRSVSCARPELGRRRGDDGAPRCG